MEWSKNKYNSYYESYVPWVEEKYLAWFGQNKTSYVAKDQLDKTKLTGDKNINAIQDGVNQGVAGQFAKGGIAEGVGNLASKEGFDRSERGGKDASGKRGLPAGMPAVPGLSGGKGDGKGKGGGFTGLGI